MNGRVWTVASALRVALIVVVVFGSARRVSGQQNQDGGQ